MASDDDSDSTWLLSAPAAEGSLPYLSCKAQIKKIRALIAAGSAEASSSEANSFWAGVNASIKSINDVYLTRSKSLDSELSVVENLLRSPTTVEEIAQALRSAASKSPPDRNATQFQIGFAGFLTVGRQIDDLRRVTAAICLAGLNGALCSSLRSTVWVCSNSSASSSERLSNRTPNR